jgi:hypothetical protein
MVMWVLMEFAGEAISCLRSSCRIGPKSDDFGKHDASTE